MFIYEVTFYGGAYGYDPATDSVVHSPARHAFHEELRGKGSLSRLATVKRLEHAGRTFRFWEAREGFYVSGLPADKVSALEAQGLRVAECPPTYAACACGGGSKYRTSPMCEHCGAELKMNPADYFVSTGENFE